MRWGFWDIRSSRPRSMDAMARGGVHFKNAFVTTSLCSPSRATILTGLYAHKHRVVDNNNPVPPGMVFFPQYLQARQAIKPPSSASGTWAATATRRGRALTTGSASVAKAPTYRARTDLNVDGHHVPQKGYITDELTDYALDWLGVRKADQPFFLYLSHKAVHAYCEPAERHRGKYSNVRVRPPKTKANTPENYAGKPMWVKNQRNSWHGVDFPLSQRSGHHRILQTLYCETLLAVDDSVGRIMDLLRSEGLLDSTLVIYMGDNGFLFGEHGLIDKRNAYEESIRVPMLMHCPELFPPGTTVDEAGREHRYGTDHSRSLRSEVACAPGRPKRHPARSGQGEALAEHAPVRVLLGAKLSSHPDHARDPDAAL